MAKAASGKLVLVEVAADKTVIRYPIDQLVKVVAKNGANYTLIDVASEVPPKKMVLRRRGDNLIVEEDGQQVAEVEDFYGDRMAATFTTDGSLAVSGNPVAGTVISSETPMELAGKEYLVWPTDDSAALLLSGSNSWGALGGLALAGAAAGGGGGGGGGLPSTLIDGIVADDYIAFAEVFADVNGNGRYDAGEPRTTTDVNGQFSLTLTNPDVTIYAVGGIDAATGVPSQFIYRTHGRTLVAGEGTEIVLSPVSTMISAVADKLADGGVVTEAILREAASKLSAALGLTLDDPALLLNLDPVANATAAGATDQDLDILAINRQLALVLSAAGGLVNGADTDNSNLGSVLAANALAALLVERADASELFELTSAGDLGELLQSTMDLSNSQGVTTDLRASNEGDLDTLSQVMAGFTGKIQEETQQDPMGDDALQSLIAGHDLLVPLLQNSGTEAAADRGGDISLSQALSGFKDDVDGNPSTYTDNVIQQQITNSSTEGFGTSVLVSGYVGDYVPLGIQLPKIGLGDVVDHVYLDLREALAPAGVELYRYDPLNNIFVKLTVSPQDITHFEVDPTQAGYLFIKTPVELTTSAVLAAPYDNGKVEIPLTATNTVDATTTTYTGTLQIYVYNRPPYVGGTVLSLSDDVPGGEATVTSGGRTNDNQPQLSGVLSAIPSGTDLEDYVVKVYDNGVFVGDAVVTPGVDGGAPTWSFQFGVVTDGTHQFTVRIHEAEGAGNLISSSAPFSVTVDTAPPQAPTIDQSNGAVVHGTGEAGSTISIRNADDEVIGTVLADANGRWTWTPPAALPEGTVIHAYATDTAGNDSVASAPVTVIPGLPGQRVIITAVNETEGVVAGDLVANNGVTNDPTLLVKGTISAPLGSGEVLRVYVGGLSIGTATVNGDGSWTLATEALSDSAHVELSARVEKTQNATVFNGADSNVWTFALDTVAPTQTVLLGNVEDDVPGTLGTLVSNSLTNDSRPTFSGSLSEGLAANETLVVYDTRTVNGQETRIRAGIATVDGDGNWTFTPSYSLADGEHNFSFRVEDAAGNTGPESDPFTFSIDTVRPRFPAGSAVTADAIYENEGSGLLVFTANATDSGNGTVSYSLKNVGDASLFTIDPVSGQVTLTEDPDYEAHASYSFTVIATDAAGNQVEQVVTLPVVNYDVSVVSTNPASVTEGVDGAEQVLVYQVVRTAAGREQAVHWEVQGTVDADDVDALSGNVTFAADALTAYVTITVKGDNAVEDDESMALVITSPDGKLDVDVDTSDAVTIVNDDAQLYVQAVNDTMAEGGNAQATPVVFRVYRNNVGVGGSEVLTETTAEWTVSGTIDAADLVGGADAMGGTVSFAAGATEAFITVLVKGDRSIEPDESLIVTISQPGDNATIDPDQATTLTTITNDDNGVSIEAVETEVSETGGQVVFRLVRSETTTSASVDYRLAGVGANAAGVEDFVAGQDGLNANDGLPSGHVSFAVGQSEIFVTVAIATDSVFEGNEDFAILLGNPSTGLTIIDGTIAGQILNDDYSYAIEATETAVLEGTGTPGTLLFRVTRSGDLDQATAVGYEISGYADNTALDDDFLTDLTGTVSFAVGESVAFLTVEIAGDGDLEGYEAFKVTLQALDANTDFSQAVAAATINPDDSGITIVALDSETFEDAGSPHVFAIQRSGYLGGSSVVSWSVSGYGGSPTDSSDFAGPTSGTVTFAAGASVAYVTVTPQSDYAYESNEAYQVVLSASQSGVILLQDRAFGRLINDESGITLNGAGLTGQEGNEGAERSLSFTVDRIGNINTETVVEWNLKHGTTSAADFVNGMPTSGFLTFAAGETAKLVTLPLTADSVVEVDKTFTVALTSHTANAEILSAPMTGTIQNDDAVFALQSFSPVLEGNGGSKQIVMTVLRTGDLSSADTVDYAVAGLTATADDFFAGTFPSGTLVFGVGQTAQTITLNLTADSVVEPDETFTVTLSNPVPGTTIDPSASTRTVTILNDDDSLSIAATSADKAEGGSGTTSYTFTVTRSGYTSKETVVGWSVPANGSLNAADFDGYAGQMPSGSVTFAAGQTSQVVTVTVKGDNLNEADEAFSVVLGAPPAGTEIATASANGVIRNDDTGLAISATTVNVAEGDTGTSQHVFTVTRSGVITGSTTVNWAVSGAVDAADFGGTLPSGTVSFGAGETVKTITINASGDTTIESNEAFTVTLSNASANADIQVATASSTIVADDIGFAISQADDQASVLEGANGESRVLSYTVTRSGDLATPAVVNWAASGLTADDFEDGTALSGTLSFSANQTSQTIYLTLKGDNTLESDETLTVTLTATQPKSYATTASVQTIIENDDVSLAIAADQAAQAEGAAAAQTAYTFTITPDGVIGEAAVVEWRLTSAQAANNDFVGGQDAIGDNSGLPSGRVTFAAGQTSAIVITVNVAGDNSVEDNEQFSINLTSAAPNLEFAAASASATITNDDTAFAVVGVSASQAEGHSGTTAYVYNIVRAGVTSGTAAVSWAVSGHGDNQASAADFSGNAFPSGTVTFADGQATESITILVNGDTEVEPTEGFKVTITGVPVLADGADVATGSIINDDMQFSVAANNASLNEGDTGSQPLIFTITRTGDTTVGATVDYAISGGATSSGSVSFAATETEKFVTVTVAGDNLVEADETYTLTLSNPSSGILGTTSAGTTVLDNDVSLAISAPVNALEGNTVGQATAFVYTVTRSGAVAGQETVVDWVVDRTNSTTNINDFVAGQDGLESNFGLPSGRITFAAGATVATITVNVAQDLQVESDETIRVLLQNAPANAYLATPHATASVLTEDTGYSIEAVDASKVEGDSGTTEFVFKIVRAGETAAATANWSVAGVLSGNTANAADFVGADFPTGTVSFDVSQTEKLLTVTVSSDLLAEFDEGFRVIIDSVSSGLIATSTAYGTIVNDDQNFSVSAEPTMAEGNSSTSLLTFTITRSGIMSGSATVDFALAGGTGVDGSDYVGSLPSGTLSFAPNEESKVVTLAVVGDTLVEGNEVYTLTLSNPTGGATLHAATASTTVSNDDTNYVLEAPDATAEGGSGTTNVVFTVHRQGDSTGTGSVNWKLQSAAGLTTSDFVGSQDMLGNNSGLPSGTVSFADGISVAYITLGVQGDTTLESDETLTIVLSSPVGGTIEGSSGSATTTLLTDDDSFSIAGASEVWEGHSGTTDVVYTITRTGSLVGQRVIDWAIGGDVDGSDLATDLSGALTFADGASIGYLTVKVSGDTAREGNENMTVTLSTAEQNIVFGTASAQTLIKNDDADVSIERQYGNESVNEGNQQANPVPYVFVVSRGGYTDQVSTVAWSVDTTLTDSVDANDFFNGVLPSGVVTFGVNETQKFVTVSLRQDSLLEADEVLNIKLGATSTGTVLDVANADAQHIIVNDDAEFNLTAGTASAVEGDNGWSGTAFTYTVTRTGNLAQENTVNWSLGGVGAQAADAYDFSNGSNGFFGAYATGYYYGAQLPSGTLTFASSVATQTITVYVRGDTGADTQTYYSGHGSSNLGSTESDETFRLSLGSASLGSSVGNTSTFDSTIVNDDTRLTITVDNASQPEKRSDNGNTDYVYTVTRTGAISGSTTVNWSIGGGSANQSDFVGGNYPSGSLSFGPNVTVATFTVTVQGDNEVENNEWFRVTLSGGSGYDEIHGTSSGLVATGGFVDAIIERDEAIFNITGYSNLNDYTGERYLGAAAEGDTLVDGGAGDIARVITIQRTIATAGEATVTWKVNPYSVPSHFNYGNAEAMDASDFVAGQDALANNGNLPSGVVTFADGQSLGYITVWIKADDAGEHDEAFQVQLVSTSPGSSVGTYNTGYLVATNDDTGFAVSVNGNVAEGETLVYTIERRDDTRGKDAVTWTWVLPGAEDTNEGNATGTLPDADWYKFDWSDVESVTASDGSIYTYDPDSRTLSGTVTFSDTVSAITISIVTKQDGWTESWRELVPSMTLSNPVNLDAGQAGEDQETPFIEVGSSGSVWVYDDEPEPLLTVSADQTTVWEGTNTGNYNGAGNQVVFTVHRGDVDGRDGALADYPTVAVWRLQGTALTQHNGDAEVLTITGDDVSGVSTPVYTPSWPSVNSTTTWGLVSFAPGQTSTTVTVTFQGDVKAESDKNLTFTLLSAADAQYAADIGYVTQPDYGPANAAPSGASVGVLLKTDDVQLSVSYDHFGQIGYTLGNYEGRDIAFTVNRTGRSDVDVVVNYEVIFNGSASNDGSDIGGALTGTITIAAGQSSTRVVLDQLDLVNDTTSEGTESFTLRLTAPADVTDPADPVYVRFDGGTSTTKDMTAYVYDDDNTYTVTTVGSNNIAESDDPTWTPFVFTIQRNSQGSPETTEVYWRVTGISEGLNADDFIYGLQTGSMSLNQGQSANVTIHVRGDRSVEIDETFKLEVYQDRTWYSNITNTFDTPFSSPTRTIVNDDTGISIADATLVESDSNQAMVFTVTRSGDLSGVSTMNWALAHLTTAAADITGATSGSLSFGANVSIQTITVTVVGDVAPEAAETFTITLTDLIGIDHSIRTQAIGTIQNDDSAFSISAGEPAAEGSGQVFTITRTHATVQDQTINWAVSGTGTLTEDDFGGVSFPSGSVVFSGTELVKTITVTSSNDTDTETDEDYTVTITTGTGTTGDLITTATATGTIVENDTTFTATANNLSRLEGHAGSGEYVLTITRSGSLAGSATVDWVVAAPGGAGVADVDDFGGSLPGGTVTFAAGETAQQVTVTIVGDETLEDDETFGITLSNAVASSADGVNVDNSTVFTITNDDSTIAISASAAVKAEGDTGTTDFVFAVVRTGYRGAAATVNYTVTGANADVNADDFNGMSGQLNLAAGDETTYLTIKVNGDQVAELDEDFSVTLSNPSEGVSITGASANGTIQADDISFSVSGPGAIAEGPEGNFTDFVFTVTRSGASGVQVLNWNVAGTGSDGADSADFDAASGTVSFDANDMVRYVTVKVKGDYSLEPDETFEFTLSGGSGATFENDGKASATILNDEVAFSLLPPTVLSVDEGSSAGSTQLVYTVLRSGVTTGVNFVEVIYSGTAVAGVDYDKGMQTSVVAFGSGDTSATFTITVARDSVVEADETIVVTLQNPTAGAFLVDAAKTFTATIVNDDSAVVINALSADKAEGHSGTTPFTFQIVRTGDLRQQVTVDYAISGISADDIVGSLNSSVVLPANQATTVLTIQVAGDRVAEADEPFTVTLSNAPAGVTLTTASADGVIRADDVVFDVTAPANALEGATGETTVFNFVVTRDGKLSGSQVLAWSVAGTGADAADSDDFVATSGYVTFAAGQTVATIGVEVVGDYASEPDESFRLSLAKESGDDQDGVVFTHSTADAIILNDEASFYVAAHTTNLNEGHGGSVDHVFAVTRTGNLNLISTVGWGVSAGATDAGDYLGGVLPDGATLTFGVGETAMLVTVKTAGDTATEADETFQVVLSGASAGSNIITGSATGKIVSDDISWSVATHNIPAVEGDAGSAYVFAVTRTGSTAATSLNWSVAGSGTHAATADDFSGNLLPSGSVVFAAGVMTQYVTVNVAGDSALEDDEDFTLTLAAPGSGNQTHNFLVQSASATIVNDDDVMSIAALDADKLEGSSGNTAFTFTVTREGSPSGVSTVGWAIDHGTTDAADFAATSGVVTFADGVSSMVLTVNVVGDRDVELAEDFSVVLQNPGSGSTIKAGNDSADGSIRNDDVDLALAGVTTTVVEGDEGAAGELVYSVTRSGDLTVTTTVNWAVVAGSATAADFVGGSLPGGTVTFAANETVKLVTVQLAGDGLDEGNESFTVQLSGQSSHADITSNNVAGTITDDDDTLSIASFLSATAEGPEGGFSNYVFAVTRAAENGNTTGSATVNWSVAGSGMAPLSQDEFVATSGSVSFAQGETTRFVTVQVKGDAVGEYDETFTITLDTPSFGSTIGTATAQATVINDDAALLISADQPAGQLEGEMGVETEYTFTVVRTGNTTEISMVDWAVQPTGEYMANAMDFGGAYPSGLLVFGIGEATKQVTVKVLGDTAGEFDETFKVVLDNAVNATVLEGEASSVILNDDTGVSIELVGQAAQVEGNTGDTTNFVYRVERVGSLAATTVAWNVYGTGDYQAGIDDFVGGVMPSGTLSFADGVSELFITVGVTGDDTYGPDESFRVVLSGNDNLINREVVSVIANDDSLVAISTMTSSLVEGDNGPRPFVFAVSRSGALGETAQVSWRVEGSGGHPADAADFGGTLPSGTVSFAADQSVVQVTVLVTGDVQAETDETFRVVLETVSGSGVSIDPMRASASATIVSDDSVFVVAADADGNVASSLALDGGAGTGFDSVYLDAADAVFDLTSIAGFANIERIDISGFGANTLQLDAAGLNSDVKLADLFSDSAESLAGFDVLGQLLVDGDADDTVEFLDSGWADAGSNVTIGGVSYDVWNNAVAQVQLLIETEVQVVNPGLVP